VLLLQCSACIAVCVLQCVCCSECVCSSVCVVSVEVYVLQRMCGVLLLLVKYVCCSVCVAVRVLEQVC